MASIKSKKGNPFEYDTAYSLQQAGYEVNRIDDNTKGVDLIATNPKELYYIECKFHKGFSWNTLTKIFRKTYETTKETNPKATPLFIFKANQQPVLVMFLGKLSIPMVMEFKHYFGDVWAKRPKGYKLWQT